MMGSTYDQCVKCLTFGFSVRYKWKCGHIHCFDCQKTCFKIDPTTRKNVQVLKCQGCVNDAAIENETKTRISNLEKRLEQQAEIIASLTKKLDTVSLNFSKIEGVLLQITESKKDHPKEASNQKISVVYENQTPSQFTYQLIGELDSLVKTMKSSLDTK